MPASGAHSTPSRNAPCPCGSGKKFKRCCGQSAVTGRATPPDRLEQVIRLYQQGNLQAAGQLAEQLLRAHPDDASLAELTAAVALQTGNAELAAERFARQIQLQPDNALAHSNLCMALHTLGRDEEAFRSGQRATQLDPALADAWNNLGNIYKSGNHLEGALEQYEKALTLAPNDPEILVNAGATSHLLGDLDTAEQRYRSAIAGSTRFASAHNNLGAVLQHQGRLDDAAREFRTALRLQPDNAEFLTNLGALMIDLHEKDKAIEYLEKAMQIAPDYEGAWTSMGNLLDRYNDQDSAQEYYEKALLFNPENSTALCNIAYRLYELGEQKKAIEYFVRALKSNPNSPKGLAGLGKAMLREDNTAKAREYIDKSLKLAPWDIHAHIANAHLLDSIMETEQAETEWLEVLAQQPNMAEAHIGLANHYSALGKYEEARRQFRKAEENGAANLNLYHAWSQMEEHIHNLEEAERLAARAVELDPSYPGIKILESKLARRRNDYAAALDHLHGTEPDSIDNKLIKASLLFELGTVQDKLGNYAEAFSAYDEANKAKNCYTGSEYDTEFDTNRFRRLREFFNTDNWQALTREIPAEDASLTCPVFIVGFPRSGTSLLEQILGSHSEISPAGELKFIGDLAGGEACKTIGSDKQFPDCLMNNVTPVNADRKTALRNYYT
ncbi:MAG: tetratricopeptide repeat protein, partial [Gammaproteobacteria bacterium]|nr:tetratricopeptide repeat protein [Gammaproteobacteria bacterium]